MIDHSECEQTGCGAKGDLDRCHECSDLFCTDHLHTIPGLRFLKACQACIVKRLATARPFDAYLSLSSEISGLLGVLDSLLRDFKAQDPAFVERMLREARSKLESARRDGYDVAFGKRAA